MSIADHKTYLTTVDVPMRLSVAAGNEPIIVPLWFAYEDGELWCACHRNSYLVKRLKSLIADAARGWPCAFDISTNEIPYRGLAGTGHVTLHAELGSDKLRALTQRYLGQTATPFAQWLLSRAEDEEALCIHPETTRYWDFSDRMTD